MDEGDRDGRESNGRAGNYLVGYGKPPLNTQFKEGKSGNPAGRQKGSRNMSTLLAEELNKPVRVVQNGRRRTITKLQALVTQLVNKAVSGDFRFLRLLLPEIRPTETPPPPAHFSEPAEVTIPTTSPFGIENARGVAKIMYELGAFDSVIETASEEEKKNLPPPRHR